MIVENITETNLVTANVVAAVSNAIILAFQNCLMYIDNDWLP